MCTETAEMFLSLGDIQGVPESFCLFVCFVLFLLTKRQAPLLRVDKMGRGARGDSSEFKNSHQEERERELSKDK